MASGDEQGTVAALLRSFRHAAGFSQEELADLAGLSVHAISAIERGVRRRPHPHTLRALASALSLPAAESAWLFAAARPSGTGARGAGPLAAGRVIPRQLPAMPAHFAGRRDELKALSGLLDREARDASTVVISAIAGMAGVGKTALAVRWAHAVAARFPDGQLYVNLRGYDPAAAPVTPLEAVRGFLVALAVPAESIPAGLPARAALYRSLLVGQRILVVLDNARDEQQVRPLLPASDGALALVTSRSGLDGLVAAEGACPVRLDALTRDEAGELLASRLGPERIAAEPGAAADLITLCARLPLALNIAAARAATHPRAALATVATDLRQARLDTLDPGDPATSVRSVFSPSYHALSPAARRAFRLLGLHPGPDISLPAAASVLGLPRRPARQLLTGLTRAHLLTEHPPGRFAFHDLLRSYAAERADRDASPEERAAGIHRMLDHYLHSAHVAARRTNPARARIPLSPPQAGVTPEDPPGHAEAREWFDAECAVLLKLPGLAARHDHDTHAWQIPTTLTGYLDRRADWPAWAEIQQVALEAATRQGDLAARARACRDQGRVLIRLGRYQDARSFLQQSIDLCGRSGDQAGQARARTDLARSFDQQGNWPAALDHAQTALGLYQAAGDRPGQAIALNHMGWSQARLGHHHQALESCQQALAIHRELGDLPGEADTSDSLGYIHHHLGDHTRAIACYQHAAALYADTSDPVQEAAALTCLGDVHRAARDLDAARGAWQQALTILGNLRRPGADAIRARLADPETIEPPRPDPPR